MTNLEIDNAYVGNEEADKIYLGEDIVWEKSGPTPPTPVPYEQQYLTIEALEDGTFNIKRANIGYSVNGGAWETTTGETALALNQGDEVRFKGTEGGIRLFSSNTLMFKVYGNIESLAYGDDFAGQTSVKFRFNNCFGACTGLVDAENLILPATTLAENCYQEMFAGCTNLTTAPELPATTLANYCYAGMFYGCTSLTTAPVLPATTLARASYCYQDMFENCTSLTTAPALPATTLAFSCYNGMFYGCTGLTQAPELPAAILADCCYASMFGGCTNLNYIKCLATDIWGDDEGQTTANWVSGVASTGTFVKAASMTDWRTGTSGIPTNWTVVDNVSQ